MAKTEYKNSIRNKNLIKEYFLELLMETNDINKVSVTEIVKRAHINRGTFYSHYADIYEVEEEIENYYIDNLARLIIEKQDKPYEIIVRINNFLKSEEFKYRKLHYILKNNNLFFDRLTNSTILTMVDIIKAKYPKLNHDIAYFEVALVANAVIGIYQEWIIGNLNIDLDQLTELFYDRIFKNYNESKIPLFSGQKK